MYEIYKSPEAYNYYVLIARVEEREVLRGPELDGYYTRLGLSTSVPTVIRPHGNIVLWYGISHDRGFGWDYEKVLTEYIRVPPSSLPTREGKAYRKMIERICAKEINEVLDGPA